MISDYVAFVIVESEKDLQIATCLFDDLVEYLVIGGSDKKYWDGAMMVEQFRKLPNVLKKKFPNARIHVVFDNSKGHEVVAGDALSVRNLNLKSDIVKNQSWTSSMRAGWYMKDGVRTEQVIEKIVEGKRWRKGMKDILSERGFSLSNLVTDCVEKRKRDDKKTEDKKSTGNKNNESSSNCNDNDNNNNNNNNNDNNNNDNNNNSSSNDGDSDALDNDFVEDEEVAYEHAQSGQCCITALLASQPDFASQVGLLKELGGEFGFDVQFLPKFHPELNPIEKLWAFMKKKLRKMALERAVTNNHRISKVDFQKQVQQVRSEVKMDHLARCFHSCREKELAYQTGSFSSTDVILKKYKSHRKVV